MPALDDLRDRARRFDDVVTIARAVTLGVSPRAVHRQVEKGIWQRLHQGVYVVHNGPPSWRTTARAALEYAGADAALSHVSAAVVHEFGLSVPKVIDVTVPSARRVAPSSGLRVHRAGSRSVEVRARFLVVDRAETAVDLSAAAAGDDGVIAAVAAAVRAGTWPEMIAEAARRRATAKNRALVLEMVALAKAGIESPLELRYHRDVERRHRLPSAVLQRREMVDGRWIRADRVYDGLAVRAELDGVLAHPGGRTDRDTWRDNAVAIEHADLTLRYRWSHVALTPCATAAQVAAALRSRGWSGRAQPCGPTCRVR